MSSDDRNDLYEMHGTVASWNKWRAEILTDCGERLWLTSLTLQRFGFEQMPKVGHRIHFWASRKIEVEVHFRIAQLRMIVPEDHDEKTLKRLRELHRAVRKRRHPDKAIIEEFAGVLERVDRKLGYVYLRLADDELLRLNTTGLGADAKLPRRGKVVRFQALELDNEWMASRLLPIKK